jgi:hypothetical protein
VFALQVEWRDKKEDGGRKDKSEMDNALALN